MREQARALTGWTADWAGRRRPGQLPLRPDAPRHGPEDDLRADRRPSTGPIPAACASSTPPTRPSSSTSSGATSSRCRRRAKTRKALERPLREARLRGPAGGRGDPHAPGLLPRPGDGEAADRLHRRAAARAPARDRRATGRGSPTSPASACSGRRTSPAGTRPAGSTPRPSAAAGSPPTRSPATTRSTTSPRLRRRPRRRRWRSSKALQVLGQPADQPPDAQGAWSATPAPSRPPRPSRLAAGAPSALLRQNALRMLIATSPEMQTC